MYPKSAMLRVLNMQCSYLPCDSHSMRGGGISLKVLGIVHHRIRHSKKKKKMKTIKKKKNKNKNKNLKT